MQTPTINPHSIPYNQKIFYWSLMLLAFLMPLHTGLSNIVLIVLFLSSVLNGTFQFKAKTQAQKILFWSLVIFYAWHLVGLLYTANLNDGSFDVQVKLPFLLFCIVFGLQPTLDKTQSQQILFAFIAGCLLTSLLCLGHAFYQFVVYKESKYFFSQDLSLVMDIHAIYLSLYCLFCCYILIFFYFEAQASMTIKQKVLVFLILFYLIAFLVLLSSRIAIFLLFIFLVVGFIGYIYKTRHYLLALLLLFLGITVVLLVLSFYPTELIKDRLSEFYNAFYFEPKTNKPSQQSRLDIWQYSIYNIMEHPLWGVGTGDVQTTLDDSYMDTHRWFYEIHLNSHNQFLQFALALGIPFSLAFISLQIWMMINTLRNQKNYLGFIFLLISNIFMLTESILVRQKGVIFFAFFLCFLFFSGKAKEAYE